MTTPVTDRFALPSPTPVTIAPVTQTALAVPARRTGLPALFTGDTMAHAGVTAISLSGLGYFAFTGGLTTSLVAVAALATGAIASRFLGNASNPNRQLGAALDAERSALNSSRTVLEHQVASLQGERANLDVDRAQLAADRQELGQRVTAEAQRIIAPQLKEIDEARAAIASERVILEERRGSISELLEKEAEGLSPEAVTAIIQAATAYYGGSGYPRFAAAGMTHGWVATPAQRLVNAEQALVTLLGTGSLVAGLAQRGSDGHWGVPAAGATTITTISQLRTFLRLATGRTV